MIQKITDKLFILNKIIPKNPIGRRMIIIKYGENRLALHSAIALAGKAKEALDKLGNVDLIIVPNQWHTLDTKTVSNHYQNAKVLCPKDLRQTLSQTCMIHGSLEENLPEELKKILEISMIKGEKKPEALVYHKEEETLIIADLLFNFKESDFSGLTKWIMKFNKAIGLGTTRLYASFMIKNNDIFTKHLNKEFQRWSIKRIIPCHGHILEENIETSLKNRRLP